MHFYGFLSKLFGEFPITMLQILKMKLRKYGMNVVTTFDVSCIIK